jgi:hypothetical protein
MPRYLPFHRVRFANKPGAALISRCFVYGQLFSIVQVLVLRTCSCAHNTLSPWSGARTRMCHLKTEYKKSRNAIPRSRGRSMFPLLRKQTLCLLSYRLLCFQDPGATSIEEISVRVKGSQGHHVSTRAVPFQGYNDFLPPGDFLSTYIFVLSRVSSNH